MTPTSRLRPLLWPPSSLAACLHQTATTAGLDPLPPAASAPSPVEPIAAALGLDADSAEVSWDDLPRALAIAGPAVLEIAGDPPAFLALLPSRRRRRVTLLDPAGRRHRLPVSQLAAALQPRPLHYPEPPDPTDAPLLARLHLSPRRAARLRRALAAERRHASPAATIHLLSRATARPLLPEIRRHRLPTILLALLASRAAQCLLFLLAWAILARGALRGHLAPAWLATWPLLLLTLATAQLAESALAARLLARGATLLRRRLLTALLALDPATLCRHGTGQLLGRILAAESLESLRLAGLPATLLALLDLALAVPLLLAGAAPRAHAALALLVLLLAALLAAAYLRAHRRATASRLAMTHDMVEQLAGHRTRRAQQSPDPCHSAEDQPLAAYHAHTHRLDLRALLLRTALPRAWLLAALAALLPAAAGTPLTSGRLAASLGGILLAHRAWADLATALLDLADAASAVDQIRPLITGSAPEPAPLSPQSISPAEFLLEARNLAIHHPETATPLLAPSTFTLRAGDRLLLTGPSGAGKSTLARLLAADQPAVAGLLLLYGLDVPTLGAAPWRRRVVLVPQLHANHLFAESLAFNLLLAHSWPPSAADLDRAGRICRDLGLGPLLARLPAGLDQRVGEAGWQLSQGETARVCLARALLQDPDLLILDESLSALDPPARLEVLACLTAQVRTLLLIAHP